MNVTLRFVSAAVAIVSLNALVLGACGSSTDSSATSTDVATSTAAPTTVEPSTVEPTTVAPSTTVPFTLPAVDEPGVAAYMVTGEHLVVVGRYLGAMDPESALTALMAGPTAAETAAGVITMVPAGTALHGVALQGSEITVDLSAEFESGGGSLSMMLRIAQVVYTATQFEGIESVRFLIDGEQREMIGGEGIMVDGVGREQFTDGVLPGILLESPFPGDTFLQPLTIRGTTNTFEATVNYQLLADDGAVLLEGMTTATCGTGCWGTFEQELPSPPAGSATPSTLRVFDYSEDDGTAMLDVVEIPLA